ncbi:hypothetical protein XENTR_v10008348 [Xenopus tropicalis]|uniref:zinc finger protein 346 n=1 Tax=Xenopus tropicalis TaxID=8364 RepID=UPI0012F63234|nr:zinc finger protein 346 [Xenopus tropicalis]KAE8614917.1 hypothetical protein XENTR_v10008348 [Xenopus tropicalis]KAE8614918.1 hypothetical protein XENTR_v10008348 [Xenopus tropicalis]
MADEFGDGDTVELPVGKEAVDALIRENSHIFSDTQCKVCSAVLISESQKLAHYQSRKHANKVRRYMSIHQGEELVSAKKFKAAPAESSDGDDRSKCCPICNMTFSSPVVAESHYSGKTHIKNLRLREQGGVTEGMLHQAKKLVVTRTPTIATKIDNRMDQSDPTKFCKLCHATFNNPLMAEQHYAGKKHKKQETKTQLMTIYTSSGHTPAQAPIAINVNSPLPGSGSAGKGFSCDTCNIVLNSIEQYQAHVSGAKHKNQLMSMTPLSKEGPPAAGGPSALAGPPSTGGALSSGGPSARGFSASGGPTPKGPSSFGGLPPMGGLMPPPYPPPHSQPYVREDMMGPDGYTYFNKDF